MPFCYLGIIIDDFFQVPTSNSLKCSPPCKTKFGKHVFTDSRYLTSLTASWVVRTFSLTFYIFYTN